MADVMPSAEQLLRWKAPVPSDGSPVAWQSGWLTPIAACSTSSTRRPVHPGAHIYVGQMPHFASPTLVGGHAHLGYHQRCGGD